MDYVALEMSAMKESAGVFLRMGQEVEDEYNSTSIWRCFKREKLLTEMNEYYDEAEAIIHDVYHAKLMLYGY